MNFKKIQAMVFAILGLKASNEILTLTAEQKQTLDKQVKKEGFAEKFEARHNEIVEAEKDNAEAMGAIDEFMASSSEEEGSQEGNPDSIPSADDEDKTLTSKVKNLTAKLTAERTAREKAEANLKKLKNDPEPDTPQVIKGEIIKNMKIQHSKTHLFATNKSWDAYEGGRNWNKLAAGLTTAETKWNTANIDRLNSDIQDYFRKDPKKLHSTFMDGLELPKYWELISGVSDEYIYTTVSTGEITQGLKKKWLPKNNARFDAQKGKVRDIQIDIEFVGNELKKLEKSYLNNFFNEGSTPFKESFIIFIIKELMKQARKEDKICIGKGVYFPNEDAETPGSFLNNFSGVIKLIAEARDVYFKSFKLGKPTEENIYDYVDNFIKKLPHEVRILPGLVFYMSPNWEKAYFEARRRRKARDINFQEIQHVDGYANIEILSYDQLEGYDLFFLTTEDNISVLTDKPGEDGVLEFQKHERNTKALGDYKLGSFIAMFGRKLVGKHTTYENQLFFANDVEVLTDVYVPVPKDSKKPSLKYHNALLVGSNNTEKTAIVNFDDIPKAGTKIYLRGDTDTKISVVKNNANIKLLDGDCQLKKDTLLVLYVKEDKKLQELYREEITADVKTEKVILTSDTTELDASLGNVFLVGENTQSTTITTITNAIEGETYRVEGGASGVPAAIDSTDNFVVDKDKITLKPGVFVEFYFNGEKFIEIKRG